MDENKRQAMIAEVMEDYAAYDEGGILMIPE